MSVLGGLWLAGYVQTWFLGGNQHSRIKAMHPRTVVYTGCILCTRWMTFFFRAGGCQGQRRHALARFRIRFLPFQPLGIFIFLVKNMDWGDVDDISTEAITSLKRSISPPLVLRNLKKAKDESNDADEPTLAAVEAGHAVIQDHLQYFRTKLAQLCRPGGENVPRLSMDAFAGLYLRNQTPHGRHFVIHQHQHPVAGIHCMF